jgi:hypothetical protein
LPIYVAQFPLAPFNCEQPLRPNEAWLTDLAAFAIATIGPKTVELPDFSGLQERSTAILPFVAGLLLSANFVPLLP